MFGFLKSPPFWMCTACVSMLANVALFYGAVDSGVTLTYIRDTLRQTTLERDVIATACNIALAGGTESEILEEISTLEEPWQKEPLGWIAGGVQFVFEDQRLSRLRYGEELDAFEDALLDQKQGAVEE